MKEFRGALSRGWDKYRGGIEFGVSKKLKFVGEAGDHSDNGERRGQQVLVAKKSG